MWRSCWLASVACVGLFSSAYPIVFVFWCFLQLFVIGCLHRQLAACIFDLSLQIPHCSSLLALLYWPMSLDSGKRTSETVRHTTWIKCIESETRHTYTWSIWCWQEKGCRYGFSWCNPKLLWSLGFPDRFLMAFGYRLGYRWGDTANMSKIVMSRSTEDTPIGVAGLQTHNSKTDWFAQETRTLRLSGYQGIGFWDIPYRLSAFGAWFPYMKSTGI